MSDTTDDMECYSGFFDEDESEEMGVLISRVEKLEKLIFGMNILINNMQKKIKILEQK